MDLAVAADAGLAQLTLGQIALNETNPVPKGPASDTSQDLDEEEDPPLRTPRKRPNNQALSGDESSGKLGAEARKQTPNKPKTAPDGPAGAAVARHQRGEGGKATGASATSTGASTAVSPSV